MKNIYYILTLFTLTLISCNNAGNKSVDNLIIDSINKKDTILHDTISLKTKEPTLVSFRMSECKGDCETTEKILSKKLINDTLKIKLATIQNCFADKICDIGAEGNTLNFLIQNKPIIRKNKKGKTDTLRVEDECDCFFYFDFIISNIKVLPEKYLINNRKFRKGPVVIIDTLQ